jgi:hypothetical protein
MFVAMGVRREHSLTELPAANAEIGGKPFFE